MLKVYTDFKIILLGVEKVTLGRTHQKNDFDWQPRTLDREAIWQRVVQLWPSVAPAKSTAVDAVGMR